MKHVYKLAAFTISTALLSACGGGGGGGESSSSSSVNNVRTGSFIDSAVEGLRYSTPTRSGLTNALGEFKYLDGEQVTFKIGGTVLGVTEGQETITPFTLFGIAPLEKESRISASLNQDTVSSFERALNVAMLLQNLDEDGDPENGIDLAQANQLLKTDSVNLIVKSKQFLSQPDLRTLLTKADVTASRDMLLSVKHIYESLDVEIESSQVSRFNSEIGLGQVQSISYQYDQNGRVTQERADNNGDGNDDVLKQTSYDAQGNIERVQDTINNITEVMTYDTNNNLTSRLTETSESTSMERYSYNINNKVRGFELDRGNDGTIDSTTLYEYEGFNLSSYTIDKDGDGEPDARADYVYENGRVATFVEDTDNNGIPELIIAYSYDENGNRQSYNISVSSDGFPTAPGKFTYDQYNNVTRYELDIDLDDSPDYIETYTYNSDRQRTAYYRDANGDGSWNSIIQYIYDESGKRTQMAEDNNGDGIADKVWKGNYQPEILENAWDVILADS